MTQSPSVRENLPKTQMSIGGPIGVFLIQALVSVAAYALALGDAMAVASCGPQPGACDWGLATSASVMTLIVIGVAGVGALIWTTWSRARGRGGIWGPIVGSTLVIVSIPLNAWLNVIAIHSLYGVPV
jgi:hypothetical protein